MACTLPKSALGSCRTCQRSFPLAFGGQAFPIIGPASSQRGLSSQAQRHGTLQWHEAEPPRTQQQSLSPRPEKLSAAAARDWLTKSLEPYTCRVAGISFEGRQGLVSQLQEGTNPPATEQRSQITAGLLLLSSAVTVKMLECFGIDCPCAVTLHACMHGGRTLQCSKCSSLHQCFTGRPVELRHEPDNPYDTNAVKVLTLDGLDLGYVPRTETAKFQFKTTFGHVISVGPAADSGLSGVLVRLLATYGHLDLILVYHIASLAQHLKQA